MSDSSETRGGPIDWFLYNATVFVASACVMSVEILSTRLAARYLGSSLYTWTSAIGVVLAGISLGNYIGGRIADRFPPKKTLSRLFVLSSLFCVLIPILNRWVGDWRALEALSWPARIFWHFVLTFLAPATLLGTMGPVVATMALDLGRATGRTIGTIYAWGAIGSIVGTFLAGFFLVAAMGTEGAVLLIAGVLALVGIVYSRKSWPPYAWAGVCLAAVLLSQSSAPGARSFAAGIGLADPHNKHMLFHEDSQYQRVTVEVDGPYGRKMVLDKLMHSQVDLRDPLELKYEYEGVYAEVMKRSRPGTAPIRALMIGGGGFVFPRYMELIYPGSHIEVAELDPVVTEAAFATFGLPKDTSIHIFNMDGRNHVTDLLRRKRDGEALPPFDFILTDAFSDYSVPYHLTTVEFVRQIDGLLGDRGVYMLNMIDSFQVGRFLGATVHTLREVFDHVYVCSTGSLEARRNTWVVVASKTRIGLSGLFDTLRSSRLDMTGSVLQPRHIKELLERNAGLVLTDDYAPVENMLALVAQTYGEGLGDEREHETAIEAARLVDANELDRAIALCRAELKARPRAAQMHYLMGAALIKQGKADEAIREFNAELQIDPKFFYAELAIGRIHESRSDFDAAILAYRRILKRDAGNGDALHALSLALRAQKKPERALEVLDGGIKRRPGYVRLHIERAHTLRKLGRRDDAFSAFERAWTLDPDYPGIRHDYGVALFNAGRIDDAIAIFRRALEDESDDARLHNQLGRALAGKNEAAKALKAFERAAELAPENPRFRANLGLAYSGQGNDTGAAREFRACLKHDADNAAVLNALVRLLASSPDDTVRNGEEAIRLAGRLGTLIGSTHPQALDSLAIAYAEAGRFDDAVETAASALAAAEQNDMAELAAAIRERLAQYGANKPFRTPRR
ncbi:MAG: fused MFS/spermidine synthase [Planctomycetota bacterium]